MIGLQLTESAARRIKSLLAEEGQTAAGLRIKVIGGGCSGLQYKIEADVRKPGDRVFERDGAKVFVDLKSFLFLNGTELEFKDGLLESGFVFNNPNVQKSCGCGASFSV
jgi:iron-sulfur cluster assembly protein